MRFPSEMSLADRATTMSMSLYDPSERHRGYFRVGGVAVGLFGIPYINSSLQRFQVVAPCAPDITVQVDLTDVIQQRTGNPLFDSGSLWRVFADDLGLRFDLTVPALGERPYRRLLIDDKYRYARLELSGEYLDQGTQLDPMEYPLDELLIMHRLTQERAIELHGTGIVRPNGDGNLFVGHSGAGKSTTTRLWTDIEEVEVLSDDRIIVRPDEPEETLSQAADSAGAKEISSTGSGQALRDCSASRTNRYAQDDKTKKGLPAPSDDTKPGPMRMYGTPWHGEAMFASPNSAPLSRIFVLEHGHGNVITRLSRSEAVGELFARSFVPFHRHEYIESALSFLEQLADSLPCYRYSFEPDERAVEKILHFHD